MAMKSILEYDTVSLSDDGAALVIIDQTLLPGEIKLLHLTGQNEIWEAIQALRVRGAPAIGVAAAIGLYLAAREIKAGERGAFLERLHAAAEYPLRGLPPDALRGEPFLGAAPHGAHSASDRGRSGGNSGGAAQGMSGHVAGGY